MTTLLPPWVGPTTIVVCRVSIVSYSCTTCRRRMGGWVCRRPTNPGGPLHRASGGGGSCTTHLEINRSECDFVSGGSSPSHLIRSMDD